MGKRKTVNDFQTKEKGKNQETGQKKKQNYLQWQLQTLTKILSKPWEKNT